MTLIIAGERSGVGKTTITLAILAFLAQKQAKVQSYKVGPDYIDPMFHTAVTGRPCRNLDPVLTSESYVQACYARHCQTVDYALIEGVMGLFDGIPFEQCSDFASTAHIARLLKLPVLLVIDCARLSGSVAAIASGYQHLDPKVSIIGVILNRVGSDRHLFLLRQALELINLPILGVLYRSDQLTIPDRHLGLIPTDELSQLNQLFAQLATLAAQSFNWEKLLPLLSPSPCPPVPPSPPLLFLPSSPRIAIARDRVFNFYYPDNLDLLTVNGAELVFWSPLEESKLPENIHGLYLGGGFPEMYAETLSANFPLRQQLRAAILAGLPTYAECGGLMYLCQFLIDFGGKVWPMVGILPTQTVMGQQLTLGYRQAIALNGPFLSPGNTLRGHEFHRSNLSIQSESPLFSLQGLLPSDSPKIEGWHHYQLHASYLHLHFGANSQFLKNFLQSCLAFSKKLR
jgi:cobyrinic acid a,c-diamide synthase